MGAIVVTAPVGDPPRPDEDLLLREAKRRKRLRRARQVVGLALVAVVVVVTLLAMGVPPFGTASAPPRTGSGVVGELALGKPIVIPADSRSYDGDRNVALSKVSCSSGSSCWAVGEMTVPEGQQLPMNGTLVEHWNGRAWRRAFLTSPDPTNGVAPQLSGISCAAANWCMVVGGNHDHGSYAAIAHGTHLREVDVPRPGNLTGVWCGSPDSCIVVGVAGGGAFLGERWNGSSWTPMSAVRDLVQPSALSCVSGSACIAVGTVVGPKGLIPGAARWDGDSWRLTGPMSGNFGRPYPVGTRPEPNPQLTSVACMTSSNCVATGSWWTSFTFRWDGSTWSQLSSLTGVPGTDVSCSSRACVLAGYGDGSVPRALVVAVTGSRVVGITPEVGGRPIAASLLGVDCVRSGACMVVGIGGPDVVTRAMAIRWDGTAWSATRFSSPPFALARPSRLVPTAHPCTGNPSAHALTVTFTVRANASRTTSGTSPTCLIVERHQVVVVVNDTPLPAVVTIGTTYVQRVRAGGEVTLRPALSDLLAPGVFSLGLTGTASAPTDGLDAFGMYAQVWVEPQCADVADGRDCHTPR